MSGNGYVCEPTCTVFNAATVASTYQVWRSCTVTPAEVGDTPIAMAVIAATPFPTAVTRPAESTVATPGASELQTSPVPDVGLPPASYSRAATGATSPVVSVRAPGTTVRATAGAPAQAPPLGVPTRNPGVESPTADERITSASRVSASPSASTSALASVNGVIGSPTAAVTTSNASFDRTLPSLFTSPQVPADVQTSPGTPVVGIDPKVTAVSSGATTVTGEVPDDTVISNVSSGRLINPVAPAGLAPANVNVPLLAAVSFTVGAPNAPDVV